MGVCGNDGERWEGGCVKGVGMGCELQWVVLEGCSGRGGGVAMGGGRKVNEEICWGLAGYLLII